MSKHTITINSPNEEQSEYYIDGEYIGSVNHNDHRWARMEVADKLVIAIAKKA